MPCLRPLRLTAFLVLCLLWEITAVAADGPLTTTWPPLPGPDRDGDGFSDLAELRAGTDPDRPDSDGDTFTDRDEFDAGTSPVDRGQFPLVRLDTTRRLRLAGDALLLRAEATVEFVITTNWVPGVMNGVVKLVPEIKTNWVTYQWSLGGTPLLRQTNRVLQVLDLAAAETGLYSIEAKVLKARHTVTVPVVVLPLRERKPLPTPVGSVVDAAAVTLPGETELGGFTNAIQLTAGPFHAAALMPNGTVRVWGDLSYHQDQLPVAATNLVAIAAGAAHMLGLRADGMVFGWGGNHFGQATPPVGLGPAVAISAGHFHSVALLADGRVVAWGDNSAGQGTVPVNLPPLRAVAAGGAHTLALIEAGQILAWGDNRFGQLKTPVGTFVAISAGTTHSAALDRFGGLHEWGAIKSGGTRVARALVAGARVTATLPPSELPRDGHLAVRGSRTVQLELPPDADADGLLDPLELAFGTDPAHADTDRDGFPDGLELRLGTNPLTGSGEPPPADDPFTWWQAFDPVNAAAAEGQLEVLPGLQIELFSSGQRAFQLQASADGQIWTDLLAPFSPPPGLTRLVTNAIPWANRFRLLPTGLATGVNSTPVAPTGTVLGTVMVFGHDELGQRRVPSTLGNVRGLAGGSGHSLAIGAGGDVFAWGANASGQCEVPRLTRPAVMVAAGGQHSLALMAGGLVVAWGGNAGGQLSLPQLDEPVIAVAAGANHSLALLTGGKVVAWGGNESGQANVPTGLPPVQMVAAGRFHSVALTRSGQVVTWGDNRYGQGQVPDDLPPVRAVAAGFTHTVALGTDGRVRCWGGNMDGQCEVPPDLDEVTAVYAGDVATFALTSKGRVRVWGRNQTSLQAEFDAASPVMVFAVGAYHAILARVPVDADADGLDDNLERSLGASAERSDSDGDGLDDATEWLGGFSLTVPSERPDGYLNAGTAVKLRFFSRPGDSYLLQRTRDFVTWFPEDRLAPSPRFADRIGFTELPIASGDNAAAWRLLRYQSLEVPDPGTAFLVSPR